LSQVVMWVTRMGKLDSEEKEILNAFESGQLKRVKNKKSIVRKIHG
jgi:hypothetical protein